MRRFIVEAAADVLLLVAVGWFLSLIPVAQPFPFGAGSAPCCPSMSSSRCTRR